jgi:hypothetical protein
MLALRSPVGVVLVIAGLMQLSPARLMVFSLRDGVLVTRAMPPHGYRAVTSSVADMNADGVPEILSLAGGRAALRTGSAAQWASPPGWDVRQARLSDLNQDGTPEAALLIWREFAPWPIDAYIPSPGRIASFHDSAGLSCHLVLIGWRRGRFQEVWAGSALARPLVSFEPVDLDGDGDEELAVLESEYGDRAGRAVTVAVWEWNGFGFDLNARSGTGRFSDLIVLETSDGADVLLAQEASWREP